jgi:hypothetical protein
MLVSPQWCPAVCWFSRPSDGLKTAWRGTATPWAGIRVRSRYGLSVEGWPLRRQLGALVSKSGVHLILTQILGPGEVGPGEVGP